MDETTSFTAVDTMIRQGWFWHQFERLESLLDSLAIKNLITETEHQSLLELGRQLSTDHQTD